MQEVLRQSRKEGKRDREMFREVMGEQMALMRELFSSGGASKRVKRPVNTTAGER